MNSKKAQVTIFIIVGILIVVAAALIFLFYPEIKTNILPEDMSPPAYLQNCMGEKMTETVEIISLQGGSTEPEPYYLYKDEKIRYLCYTNEYYVACIMQQPLLKQHIESEIKKEIESELNTCFNSLVEEQKGKGYNVNLEKKAFAVEIVPGNILILSNNSLTLTKDSSVNYESFKISYESSMYDFVSIAGSILNWEATYGNAETTEYMNYYRDLKVEKLTQSEGTKIYVLTNSDKGDKFQFASRSVAWPPGYG